MLKQALHPSAQKSISVSTDTSIVVELLVINNISRLYFSVKFFTWRFLLCIIFWNGMLGLHPLHLTSQKWDNFDLQRLPQNLTELSGGPLKLVANLLNFPKSLASPSLETPNY